MDHRYPSHTITIAFGMLAVVSLIALILASISVARSSALSDTTESTKTNVQTLANDVNELSKKIGLSGVTFTTFLNTTEPAPDSGVLVGKEQSLIIPATNGDVTIVSSQTQYGADVISITPVSRSTPKPSVDMSIKSSGVYRFFITVRAADYKYAEGNDPGVSVGISINHSVYPAQESAALWVPQETVSDFYRRCATFVYTVSLLSGDQIDVLNLVFEQMFWFIQITIEKIADVQ